MCLVKSQGTNRVLLQGVVRADGLYSFNNLQLQYHSSTSLSSSSGLATIISLFSVVRVDVNANSDVNSGHPNSHVMKLVMNHCKISPSNKIDSHFCSSCCMGKSHKLPSYTSNSVYSPLELIFTNIWGPSHITSYARYKYYVSFIDAYSRFTWIFPIKSKVETLSNFQTFKSMVELQLNTKIKQVQPD
uniref:Retrovirus-related Pol polyprotein from transposon TNT 1-94 n=1 Tax=Cajanus cajan TaxID=3821 RepID=A0A151QQY5_CAJCA|nr:Retrovirus-related Pol polyprotein from transposon TNT 1-94 [Cajanus cajan]